MVLRVSLSFLLFPVGLALAQVGTRPVEGLRENTPRVHVLKGARVFTGPGEVVDGASVVVRDGLVEAVGETGSIQEPEDARVWDLAGKTVYAGFIEPWLEVPVGDSGEGEARHWNPKIRPEREASGALDTLSEEKREGLRALGFTTAQLVPEAGVFQGASCLVSLGESGPGGRMMAGGVAQCAAFEHGGGGYPSSLMGSIALVRQVLYDAQWQRDARAKYQEDPDGRERVEANVALEALRPVVDGTQRVLFRARDELSYPRFLKVADEFSLESGFLGNGFEYRVAEAIKAAAVPVVVPVNFPGAPPVDDPDLALEVSLAELEHWDLAPSNPAMLEAAGIRFSVTTATLADAKGKFWKNLRAAAGRGLSESSALAALTTEPAKLVGASERLGTIGKGKIANFVVADGDLLGPDGAKIHSVWIDGERYEQEAAKEIDLEGVWNVEVSGGGEAEEWEIRGSGKGIKIKSGEKSLAGKISDRNLFMVFPEDEDGIKRFTARVHDPRALEGLALTPEGGTVSWSAVWKSAIEAEAEKEEETPGTGDEAARSVQRYPAGAFGFARAPDQPSAFVVRGVTLWTSAEAGILENADLLVQDGKIAAVGVGLEVPPGTRVLDLAGTGKHVTPGLIDCHSHIAMSRGINEGTDAVTVEVRVGDVVDPTDIGIYRQLAGGLTTSNLLHGSANPMGGQNQVIKLRWGSDADGLKFKGAKPGVKFALGENVKQSNWGDEKTTRYPQTRMGVQQIMRDTFLAARDYEREAGGRRNLRLEAVREILDRERIVHIHSYRQDEILMFVRLAEEFGFTVGTFQHVLEGYKVADAIAKLGAGGSTFSDWWGFKMEVYDAIPYNGALMRDVGVLTSFNSDDSELATRMNLEAAKAVKYGGVPEAEALRFVTINPAKQLRIDDRVGSLEVGKDADFVIWTEHPMAGSAAVSETWIDGRRYFARDEYETELVRIGAERARLVGKAVAERNNRNEEDDEKPANGDGDDEDEKPGLLFLLPNALIENECRSQWRGLYHDGRNGHTCSRNGCCNN